MTHVFAALPKIGIVATQTGGKWYIDPLRSYADLSTAVLSGLDKGDLLTLIGIADN